MPRAPVLLLAGAVVTVAYSAALMIGPLYRLDVRDRAGVGVAPSNDSRQQPAARSSALALRLVDSGGVGISPSDRWGADFSHDARSFRHVILEGPPYVDLAALKQVERDWRTYVMRMAGYGNNAIAIPLWLPLVNFDELTGPPVYPDESAFRARHLAVRRHFAGLFEWASSRGMGVFVVTDMLALTPPLHEYLRRAAPHGGPTGIDVSSPDVWKIYAAGFAELFDSMPSLQGAVIRIGEAGSLYNSPGWPYYSEVAVRDTRSVGAMLEGVLPIFESRGKTLVLRTWTVGVGPLGRLHIDCNVYEETLSTIDSPSLVVSTKFTAGDFFSYMPLNPSLAAGRHRRLVELQASPEFEGFGAFPDFLGSEFSDALRTFVETNPRLTGTFLSTQYGGPLRAGPRSLYPLHSGCGLMPMCSLHRAWQSIPGRTSIAC